MKTINYETYKKPSDFMSFTEGETKIRVVSSGVIGFQHGMRTANHYVNLGICSEDENCENCKKGYEPKRVWKWIVLDYTDMRVKILDAGPMLGNQICTLGGDPQDFDILVMATGVNLQRKYVASKLGKTEIPEEVKKTLEFSKKRLVTKYLKGAK